MEGNQEEENVDQYFDDGGETFLQADHVSSLVWTSRYNTLNLNFMLTSFIAAYGETTKCLDKTTDGRARTGGLVTPWERRRSPQGQTIQRRDRCLALWCAALIGAHANNLWAHSRQLQYCSTIPRWGWKTTRNFAETVRSKERGGGWTAETCTQSVGRT